MTGMLINPYRFAAPGGGTVAVADNFNRADSTTSLGSTSTGSVPWQALFGTWGIKTNAGYHPGGAAVCLAVVETGVADGTVEVTVREASATANFGFCFRAVDVNNHWLLESGAGSTAKLYKKVGGGSYTVVAQTAGNVSFATNDVIQVVLAGSSITVKQNGTTIITATDSALSTATKHGLYAYGTPSPQTRFDDFSVTT